LLIQSRLYPNHHNIALADTYRDVVQKIITECLGVTNKWELSRNTGQVSRSCSSDHRFTHYKDYTSGEYNCTLSTISDIECSNQLSIGSPALCIECGSEQNDSSQMLCRSCFCEHEKNARRGDEPFATCNYCGSEIQTEDDAYYTESAGGVYCGDCVSYCDTCNAYYFNDEITRTCDGGSYCECCLEEYYFYCDHCDEWLLREDVPYELVNFVCSQNILNQERWCKACIDDNDVKKCVECDAYYTGKMCVCEWNQRKQKKQQTAGVCC